MAAIMFYGDFNCPFCFVENERLVKMGVHGEVDFRTVEHWPELPTPWDPAAADPRERLADEVPRANERAPDVEVKIPASVPNSRPASIAYFEALHLDAHKAAELRTLLFRALWRDNEDISSEAVIARAWERAGLPPRGDSRREGRRAVKLWTTEWANGPFDRRIPVLATADGERLLGLAEAERIREFLDDPTLGGHGTEVCKTPS